MILRFLLKDITEMGKKVIEIIQENKVLVTTEVTAEVVYVMHKIYNATREDICTMMIMFISIPNIYVTEYSVISRALELFRSTSLDFVDCMLCAYHQIYGYDICTFDKKLQKLISRSDTNSKEKLPLQ